MSVTHWSPRSPYNFAPIAHAQLTVSGVVNLTAAVNAASSPVAIPTNAVMVLIACETANIRWTDDGQTPSSSFGMLMSVGQEFAYSGNLIAIQFAAVSGTPLLDIAYYGLL